MLVGNTDLFCSYLDNGPYWIGYDDEESVVAKTKFANFMDLGGYFVWSIEFDNFRGDWGQPKYPLLKVSRF